MSIPTANYLPGWPITLRDREGVAYVRLRDGVPTSDCMGHSTLYARIGTDGTLDTRAQYVPALSTEGGITMAGGSWMSAWEFEKQGLPPIEVPASRVPLPE